MPKGDIACNTHLFLFTLKKNSNPDLPFQPIPAIFCRLVQFHSCRLQPPEEQILLPILLVSPVPDFGGGSLSACGPCPDRQSRGSNSLLVKHSNPACPLSTKRRLKLRAAWGWPQTPARRATGE
jgi:hypothetical protein